MRQTVQSLVLILAAIALGACSGLPPDEPAEPTVLTVNDSGRTISIRVGHGFTVRLAANPTTGYQWAWVTADEGVVSPEGDPVFIQDAVPSGMVGVGGVEVRRFRGARAGHQTTLSFEYRRPWEDPSTPAQRVTYVITVR
jgi:inhibitor of cysteine peptidase